jgi:hypothetical protein
LLTSKHEPAIGSACPAKPARDGQAPIDASAGLHPIVIRGIERKGIIEDDKDHGDLLERLSHLLQETATPRYEWALMPPHVQLLVRTGVIPVASITGQSNKTTGDYTESRRLWVLSMGCSPLTAGLIEKASGEPNQDAL